LKDDADEVLANELRHGVALLLQRHLEPAQASTLFHMIAANARFSCELSIFELMGTPSIKNLRFTPAHTTFIQDVPMKWVLLYTS